MNTHVEELIAYPQRHFRRPDEVLTEPKLTVAEKRRILESWKLDAQRLAESTAENMTGGEETDLREVSKVLIQLKSMEDMPQARQPETGMAVGAGAVGAGMAIGALAGAGAGLVIAAVTVPSIALVAQVTVVGLIVGGVAAAMRKSLR